MNTLTKIILLSIGVIFGALAVGATKEKTEFPRRRKFGSRDNKDIVDEASQESFPASDAPSWNTSQSSDKLH